MIKVLLVDDDALVREGVAGLLRQQSGFEVCDALDSGESALAYIQQNPVDIVLLDLNMPGWGGYETTKKLHQQFPHLGIIILTVSKSEALPKHLLKAGARGYLTKGCDVRELCEAIILVHQGKQYISNELSRLIALRLQQFQNSPFENLSAREMQIIIMLLHGVKSSEISRQLHITNKTVSTHKSNAYEKLGIDNDVALFHLAIQYQLINTN